MHSSTDSPFVVIMIILMLILALAIILLAHALVGAAQYVSEKDKEDGSATGERPLIKNGAGIAALGSSAAAGIPATAFYLIMGVIFLEVIVILVLLFNLRKLISQRRQKVGPATQASEAMSISKRLAGWWRRMNSLQPVAKDADLDLGHDYDGIRELDNRLPPWWLYGFYGTILFACIYLWRYHVSHSAPLSHEEYQTEVRIAEEHKTAYLKKAAGLVDENTVIQLKSPADLAEGRAVFESSCFPCHGKHGEGIVGPNLTDEYWLHGGDIKDIFKTIKYGWPDKGMKSWKDDFSPSQIAQIASYVKSLGGTHPANAKEPQGSLYKP